MRGVFSVKHKQFVKQIMAKGWGRNSATAAAYLARLKGVPYFYALGDVLLRIDYIAAKGTGHDTLRPPASMNNWLKSIDEAVGI